MNRLLALPVNKKAEDYFKTKKHSSATIWMMLFSRITLFVVFQLCFYILFLLLGKIDPWMMAAAYWPFVMILTNVVCTILLSSLLKREGSRFKDFFAIKKDTFFQDLLLSLGLFCVVGVVGFLPSPLLGNLFFGDVMIGNRLFFQPLPQWAAVVTLIFFPLSMPFGELTTYFGYVMPRLELSIKSKVYAIVLPALMLSLQHAALPLLFNLGGMFLLWRSLVFLPFAFLLALIIRWRPLASVFPYRSFPD